MTAARDEARTLARKVKDGWHAQLSGHSNSIQAGHDGYVALDALEARAAQAEQLEAALREPEKIARLFHEAYERLAPSFGYETRTDSAVPWDDVPEPNRSLMVAVAAEVAAALSGLGDAG